MRRLSLRTFQLRSGTISFRNLCNCIVMKVLKSSIFFVFAKYFIFKPFGLMNQIRDPSLLIQTTIRTPLPKKGSTQTSYH